MRTGRRRKRGAKVGAIECRHALCSEESAVRTRSFRRKLVLFAPISYRFVMAALSFPRIPHLAPGPWLQGSLRAFPFSLRSAPEAKLAYVTEPAPRSGLVPSRSAACPALLFPSL